MREHPLRLFVESVQEEPLPHQAVQEARRAATRILVREVFRRRDDDRLRVPADEAEAAVGADAIAKGIPVVLVPVGVPSVEVDEHVVDEVVHVEQRRVLHVGLAVASAADEVHVALLVGQLVDEVDHLVPRVDGSVVGKRSILVACAAVHLRHVPVLLAAAEVLGTEVVRDTLAHIVDTPIEAVEEEVNILPHADRVAHLRLRGPSPEVASVLSPVALHIVPMHPRIAEEGAENEGVEAIRTMSAEDRILEFPRAVGRLEVETEGMLRVLLRQSSVPAVQLDATVYGEVETIRPVQHLEGDRPLPSTSRAIAHGTAREDVDAARFRVGRVAEQVAGSSGERDDGQRGDALGNILGIGGVARQLEVHPIVGNGSSLYLAVVAPVGRIAARTIALLQEALGDDVGGRGHVAPGAVGQEKRRTDHRRGIDAERAAIGESLPSRVAAVLRIEDGSTLHGRRYPKPELLTVDAMLRAERRRLSAHRPYCQQGHQHAEP